VLGNLRRQRLSRIWDCELFSVLSDRTDRGGYCAHCNFRAYCGGCRARALAYTGDIKEGDPGCCYNQPRPEEPAEYSEPPGREPCEPWLSHQDAVQG
jgi:MoaA/NifB/PqqE/SkfB family radical SAM enzyme